MEPKHWEVFTVAPVERVGDVEWTPVALDQMLNGGGPCARLPRVGTRDRDAGRRVRVPKAGLRRRRF